MLADTLGPCLLRNMLTEKKVARSQEGKIRAHGKTNKLNGNF